MIKCSRCNGHKTILGMGNMRENCKECEGKGFIEDKAIPPIDVKKSKGKMNDRES